MATFRVLDSQLELSSVGMTAERSLEFSNTIEHMLEITPEMGIRCRAVTALGGGRQRVELETGEGHAFGTLEGDASVHVAPGDPVNLDWSLGR
jgi:hypothetical protein